MLNPDEGNLEEGYVGVEEPGRTLVSDVIDYIAASYYQSVEELSRDNMDQALDWNVRARQVLESFGDVARVLSGQELDEPTDKRNPESVLYEGDDPILTPRQLRSSPSADRDHLSHEDTFKAFNTGLKGCGVPELENRDIVVAPLASAIPLAISIEDPENVTVLDYSSHERHTSFPRVPPKDAYMISESDRALVVDDVVQSGDTMESVMGKVSDLGVDEVYGVGWRTRSEDDIYFRFDEGAVEYSSDNFSRRKFQVHDF